MLFQESKFLAWKQAEGAAREADIRIHDKCCRLDSAAIPSSAEIAGVEAARAQASNLLRAFLEETRLRAAILKRR